MRIFKRIALLSIPFLFPPLAHPQSLVSDHKLNTLHFSGLSRFKEVQVIPVSGLKKGQMVGLSKLDEVTQKLGRSGVFEEVRYSYKTDGDGIAVEFIVKEAERFHQCVFDNFVWLKQSEIDSYLREQLPLFDGAAPETGDILDEISTGLENLSKTHGITTNVTRIQYGKLGDLNWQHRYAATGLAIKITDVRFSGNQGVEEAMLAREAKPLLGRDYSATDCREFGRTTFVPYYRNHGYLRMSLADPVVEVAKHADGTQDFEVHILYPLQEGVPYFWDGVEWSSNQAISSGDLNGLLGMKRGDVANGTKLDDGMEKIQKEYKKRGYFQSQFKTQTVFADDTRKVTYRVQVDEGGQYHMGSLRIEGLPDQTAENLQTKCRLKVGDIFESSYLMDFINKEIMPMRTKTGKPLKVSYTMTPHPEQLTVDVLIHAE